MTEKQELKAKALELSINLYTGLSEKIKNQLFTIATGGKKDAAAEEIVLNSADTFLKYIS